jgi:uncharacterized protein (TIGR01777 family)
MAAIREGDMPVFERRCVMPVSADELYAYFARPGAFERLVPPWQRLRVLEQSGGGREGGRLIFEFGAGPAKRRWWAERTGHVQGRQFVDRQVEGPFRHWEHTHRFVPMDDHRSELIDHVEYSLPARSVAEIIGRGTVEKRLSRLFRFRHARTHFDLERHAAWVQAPRLKVAIAGASGLIGSDLAVYLTPAGHEVLRLVRRSPAGPDEIYWDSASGRLDPAALAGVDAVVNFSGERLAGLWTASKRQAILQSRVQATATLARTLALMGDQRPGVFVSPSAVGAYGSQGGEALSETSARGADFLADVCAAWEGAAAPAADAGVRVVHPRLGLVLTPQGGALAPLLPLFKAGMGGRVGDGRQWWSWVAIDDVLAALEWLLHDAVLAGPVNVTAPEPVTNRVFTATLARVLRRPAVFAAPSRVVEGVAGDMGRQMLMASQRTLPLRLRERRFAFGYPSLEGALRFLLGRA